MSEARVDPAVAAVEEQMRRALVQAGVALRAVEPVLRHLLGHDDRALYNDEVMARLQGILHDLARQLCQELAAAWGDAEPLAADDPAIGALGQDLTQVAGLLRYLHASVLEWQSTRQLQAQLGVEPVVSPLLQALLASSEPETASLAMKLLAAQARFARQLQHMRMPLGELPADLLHGALEMLGDFAGRAGGKSETAACVAEARSTVRDRYDESASRLGLIARLVTGMGGGALAALALDHAGVAIFGTGLAIVSGHDREDCIYALQEGQAARLAVMLRAAGIKPATTQEALLALNPSSEFAEAIVRIPADRAAVLLAEAGNTDGSRHGG